MVNEVINHVGEEYTVPDVSMKTIMEMNEMLSKFYKHPNGEQGTVNRLIGFNKTAHHKLQFHEDIRMGEDLLFMVDAVMAEKRGELKLNYLHDENLYEICLHPVLAHVQICCNFVFAQTTSSFQQNVRQG